VETRGPFRGPYFAERSAKLPGPPKKMLTPGKPKWRPRSTSSGGSATFTTLDGVESVALRDHSGASDLA
jgi:hypothetical protein